MLAIARWLSAWFGLDDARRRRPSIARPPACESLEGRQLLTASGASSSHASAVARARRDYHALTLEVTDLHLKSAVTTAEFAALRDDARDLGAAIGPGPASQAKAEVATVQLSRAPVEGWLGADGWSNVDARLTANLDGLAVPQPLIDRTVADMRALATSAGATSYDFRQFSARSERLGTDEDYLGSGNPGLPDPGLYFTSHLRGYVRDWQKGQAADEAKLTTDTRSILAASHASTSDAATLRADLGLLRGGGDAATGPVFGQVGDAYVAGVSAGGSGLSASLRGILNANGVTSQDGAADRLAADAPAFFRASGSSTANVRTLVDDVSRLAGDVGSGPLDPFRVHVGG